jgi:hypothetical protein
MTQFIGQFLCNPTAVVIGMNAAFSFGRRE